MENDNLNINDGKRDYTTVLYTFQTVFISLFLLAAIILKFALPDFFSQIKNKYIELFCDETTLSEIFDKNSREYNSEYSVYSE